MQISFDGEAETSVDGTDLIQTEAAPFRFEANDVAKCDSVFRTVLSNVPGPARVRSEPFDVKHRVRLFGVRSNARNAGEKLLGHEVISR